jgi:hypothetical protein
VFIVLFVCCLIVVPLPLGENPFAVNNNNNNNNNNNIIIIKYLEAISNLQPEDVPCSGEQGTHLTWCNIV